VKGVGASCTSAAMSAAAARGIKHVGNINILILLKICAEKSLFCIRKCEAKTQTHSHTHTHKQHKLNKMASTKGCATQIVVVVVAVVVASHGDVCNDKRC